MQQPWPSLTTWALQLPTPTRLPIEDHCQRGRGSLGTQCEEAAGDLRMMCLGVALPPTLAPFDHHGIW